MKHIDKIIAALQASDVPLSQVALAEKIDRATSVVYDTIRLYRRSGAEPRIYVAEYGKTDRGQRSPAYAVGDKEDAPLPYAVAQMLKSRNVIKGQFGEIDEAKSRAAKIAAHDKLIAALLPTLRGHRGNPFGVCIAQCEVRA